MASYLLHEFHESYYPNAHIGKKFSRIVLISFLIYYFVYFYLPDDLFWVKHFLKRFIIADIVASSIFYGGIFKTLFFAVEPPPEKQYNLNDPTNSDELNEIDKIDKIDKIDEN